MSDIKKWKALVENVSKLTEDPVQDTDYTDHEVSMAKSQMLSSMKSINRIAKHLATKSESEGLEGWTASKLTMAEDYLQVVADYFDGKEINEGYKVLPPMDKEKYQARDGLEGPFSTLSGKVVYYDPKAGKYYDPDTDMYMSYDEFRRYDDDYKGMKEEQVEENFDANVMTGHELMDKMEQREEEVGYPGSKAWMAGRRIAGWFKDKKITPNEVTRVPMVGKSKLAALEDFLGFSLSKPTFRSSRIEEAHQIDWPYEEMEQQAYNAIRHDFHAYDAFDHLFSMAKDEYRRDWLKDNKDDIIKMFAQYGLQTESLEESEALTEEQFDEAAGEKDACYHKVKSRYKVWPSAYASGALVKCRKVGAKNWGNSKKK